MPVSIEDIFFFISAVPAVITHYSGVRPQPKKTRRGHGRKNPSKFHKFTATITPPVYKCLNNKYINTGGQI